MPFSSRYLLPLLAALAPGCRDTATVAAKPLTTLPADAQYLMQRGDLLAADGKLADADRAYQEAWSKVRDLAEARTSEAAFFVPLASLNVRVLAKRYDAGLVLAHEMMRSFDGRLYIGNPLFHLRIGQCQYERADGQGRERAEDEFARALTGAGVELFDGEDPKYLQFISAVLRPPDPHLDWQSSRGWTPVARYRLNGATGFLAEILTRKLGSPPPYRK